MKIKSLLLNLLFLLCIIGCNGQEKSPTILPKKEMSKSSVPDQLYKVERLYFNSEDKLIFSSTLAKDLGKFAVYYLPVSEQSENYYENFEKNNKITPLYDEENSLNYYSPEDQKKIDAILKVKTKSEKDFKIVGTFVPKEYITFENREEYAINFPYIQKYYKKENGKWIYLFEKKITKAEDEIAYNSKNYMASLVPDSIKTKAKTSNNQYTDNGTWQIDCEKGVGSFSVDGRNASLIVLYNQIYIDLTEVKRYDFEKGIAYKLKEIPEDVGSIGRDLNWKEYVNNEPIVYIKMIDDKTIHFYWYGFYNKKTKKREFTEVNFNQETNDKEIVLKKCN